MADQLPDDLVPAPDDLEPAPAAAPQAEPTPAAQPMSKADRIKQLLVSFAGLASGGPQGFINTFDDETKNDFLLGAMRGATADAAPMVSRVSARMQGMNERGDQAFIDAEERSPIATAIGRGVGMLPMAIAATPAAASLLGTALTGGLSGGALALIQGALGSQVGAGARSNTDPGGEFSVDNLGGKALDAVSQVRLPVASGVLAPLAIAGGSKYLASRKDTSTPALHRLYAMLGKGKGSERADDLASQMDDVANAAAKPADAVDNVVPMKKRPDTGYRVEDTGEMKALDPDIDAVGKGDDVKSGINVGKMSRADYDRMWAEARAKAAAEKSGGSDFSNAMSGKKPENTVPGGKGVDSYQAMGTGTAKDPDKTRRITLEEFKPAINEMGYTTDGYPLYTKDQIDEFMAQVNAAAKNKNPQLAIGTQREASEAEFMAAKDALKRLQERGLVVDDVPAGKGGTAVAGPDEFAPDHMPPKIKQSSGDTGIRQGAGEYLDIMGAQPARPSDSGIRGQAGEYLDIMGAEQQRLNRAGQVKKGPITVPGFDPNAPPPMPTQPIPPPTRPPMRNAAPIDAPAGFEEALQAEMAGPQQVRPPMGHVDPVTVPGWRGVGPTREAEASNISADVLAGKARARRMAENVGQTLGAVKGLASGGMLDAGAGAYVGKRMAGKAFDSANWAHDKIYEYAQRMLSDPAKLARLEMQGGQMGSAASYILDGARNGGEAAMSARAFIVASQPWFREMLKEDEN